MLPPPSIRTRVYLALIVLGLLLPLNTVPARAEGREPEGTRSSPPLIAEPLERANVKQFFDEIMDTHLERYRIPGATVAVVKDGELLFSGGYGYADLERGIPFDPEHSLVRIASISKLFTWTAVMQLVEQGTLDLNTDVNQYLTAFELPATYPEPVTLAHLMTHTAGLEDRTIGIAARHKEDVPPLGQFLAGHLPARIRPPGVVSAYSNHGAALAGHIVSEVSGIPYEQYVQERILAPLGMEHSTAWEPVPEPLRADLAVSYEDDNGTYRAVPFTYDILVPDGSISATAGDMAKFMIAHLQEGRYGDTGLLQESTARQMHSRSFTHHPALNGWAHGFMEFTFNEQPALGHDGSWEAFQSVLLLLPQHELGLFVSYNSAGAFEAFPEMMQAFFDRYFPVTAAPEDAPPLSVEQPVGGLAGWYRLARHSESTIEKVVTLVESARMIPREDGTLQFRGRTWTALEPLLYREEGGTDLMAFLSDEQGESRYVAIGRVAYERVPWYESIRFNLALLGIVVLLSLSAIIGWPLATLVRRFRNRQDERGPRGPQAARWVVALASGLTLLFLVLFTIILLGDTSEFLFGVPARFHLLMMLPLLITAFTVIALGQSVIAWKEGYWSRRGRLHYTMVVLGMVLFVWFLNTWNLLGFRYG